MSRTQVLFSVQMHQLRGCMQKFVLIKQIHVLNSHYQAALMTSIKETKTCHQTNFFDLLKSENELDSLIW